MLDALQTLLTRATGPVFVDDEEDRLVLVVVDVIGRETISDDELSDWIDTFGSWLAGRSGAFDPASRAAAVNLKRFVRTLHLALCSRAHRRELKFDKPEMAALDVARRFAAGPIWTQTRLHDQDVARGVVGDLVGDRAEDPADALHAAVADDDQLGLEALGLGDQGLGRLLVDRRGRGVDALGPERRRLLLGDLLGGLQAGDDRTRRRRRRRRSTPPLLE